MRNKQIAILGAGIGGLTTAIALCQKGFKHITVYDRMTSSMEGGAGLVLWPNASCILSNLGLQAEVLKLGGTLSKMQRYSHEGEKLGDISITELERLIGYPAVPIARSDLWQLLTQKTKTLGIPVLYARNVEDIYTNSDNRTCVAFSDQESIVPDVIVGADGRMQSIARKFVTGNNTPIYQHYVNWVGLIDGEAHQINQNKSVYDYWGIGERFGYVPIRDDKSYWAGCKKLPLGHGRQEKGDKDELASIFKNWPDPIPRIIESTEEGNIRRIEVFDHDPIESWYLHNVCLLGDAAHAALPTSGQGACQAIEDSWHLAGCLSRFDDDLEQAFINYEQLRSQKTRSIILGARGFAESLFNEDEKLCRIRNENAKLADGLAVAQGMANLWAGGLPK